VEPIGEPDSTIPPESADLTNQKVILSIEIALFAELPHSEIMSDIEAAIEEMKRLNLKFNCESRSYLSVSGEQLKCYALDRDAMFALIVNYSRLARAKIVRHWVNNIPNPEYADAIPPVEEIEEPEVEQEAEPVAFEIDIYIKNIGGDDVNAVNARELWEKLEVKTDFSDWIKARIEKYEFVEGIDFCRFLKKKEANNATMTDYFISLDMAKELSMVENNAQGKIARRYFIACEKQAKSKAKKIDHLSPEVIACLKQARTAQLAMGMNKVQSGEYAPELIQDRFGIDMELSVTGSRNKQLHF
jgi:phage anti-repressor protein